MKDHSEEWSDIEGSTLTEEQADKQFDDGFGSAKGCAFTVWTPRRVYFPICYDGAEHCGSAARYPDGKPTEHQGGW
jgi:hypothetical protein